MVQTTAQIAGVHVILPFVREDEQFHGIQPFNLEQIRSSFTDRQQYNTVLSNYAAGAIVSSAANEHFLSADDAGCSLCGASGGATHLLYQCPGTADIRTGMVQFLDQLPNAIKVSSLVPLAPEMGSFRVGLANQTIGTVYTFGEPVHLFTDGLTLLPTVPELSVSAWAIVLAEVGSFEKTLVHAAVLPGLGQENHRAELFAVVEAADSTWCSYTLILPSLCLDGKTWLHMDGWRQTGLLQLTKTCGSNYIRLWQVLLLGGSCTK